MDIKAELHDLKKQIDKEIEIYLDQVIIEAKSTDIFVAGATKHFKKMILAGGKRLRPIMMYWGYVAAGGQDRAEIVKTSISIELIHAFLLMHDDIIDRDDLRHGKKTMHAHYRDHYNRFFLGDDAEHFGRSIAIVTGDFVYSLGNQVIFASHFEPAIIVRALNKMQNIVGLTCVGEIQDIYMEYSRKVTEANILKMYENKTARYTFDGPLKLGAIFAGADDTFCDKLSAYAIPLGIAFQIRDDILGVYGDSKKTGKPVGSDIAEGKMTFLVHRAYKNSTPQQKEILDRYFGKGNIDEKGVKIFGDVLIATGAMAQADAYIHLLVEQALEALDNVDIPAQAKEFFLSLANHLNNREY